MLFPHATTPRRARALTTATVLVVLPIAGAGAAGAVEIPGNNGTLKVHAPTTPFSERANEPKQVCDFYLAGFGFDSDQVVNYRFTVQGGPNNKDAAGEPGSFTTGPDNDMPDRDGRTPVLDAGALGLTDGRYKVTATTDDGSKSKVFTVECPGDTDPVTVPDGRPDPAPEGEVAGVNTPEERAEVQGEREVRGERAPDEQTRREARDDGPPAVGGVDTGGGFAAAPEQGTLPLALLGAGVVAAAGVAVRRRLG